MQAPACFLKLGCPLPRYVVPLLVLLPQTGAATTRDRRGLKVRARFQKAPHLKQYQSEMHHMGGTILADS